MERRFLNEPNKTHSEQNPSFSKTEPKLNRNNKSIPHISKQLHTIKATYKQINKLTDREMDIVVT